MTAPSDTHQQLLTREQLSARNRQSAVNHQILNPVLEPGSAVLKGSFEVTRLRAGLVLHRADVEDLHAMTIQATLSPGMTLALVMDGRADISYGKQRFLLGPRCDAGGNLLREGVLTSFAETDSFSRRSQRGGSERTVSIGMTPEWLEDGLAEFASHASVMAFNRRHLASLTWRPSARAIALAEQMFRPPRHVGSLHHLYLESRVLEFLIEALNASSLALKPQQHKGLRLKEYQRIDRLRALLDSGEADQMSLEQIAGQAGINANTMQRQFRAICGSTVFEYLRDRRLQQAQQALEQDGASVSEAAAIAGYSNPANFATAFKRKYSITPKLARARLS
ncbi:Transcriptional regulator [Collimonas arenae]|uniref:Transcriptional regulator n=1 Tax=Collimonas arenae TaxID=279058 RepID=A0A0A1FDN4_9BURK|nr:AraC family transcriptional regulator [Collimonas arenae]AIY40972.1 Transcriptional regulator [Collimonas arenae]